MKACFRLLAGAACLAVVTAAPSLLAQTARRPLSLDAIYDPVTRVNFSGTPTPAVTWVDEQTYVTARRGNGGVEWVTVDADSGRATPLFEGDRMEAALVAASVSRDEARRTARSRELIFNRGYSAAIVTVGSDLYVYEFAQGRARRLTSTPGDEDEVTFSPDGRLAAFVRQNNLFVVDVASARERPLTTDGGDEVLNGKLDWLYQEEIYGRGTFKAYWWSPDSSKVAFLRLDEHNVPKYPIVDHLPYRGEVEFEHYPKAGDPNPGVRLGVARVDTAPSTTLSTWASLLPDESGDILIVNVGWSPDSTRVVAQVQDRAQTWLDLNLIDPSSGVPRRVLREKTKAWVNDNGNPVWLRDGSFLWLSERSGFRHLYRYRVDGTLLRQITSGRWDVRRFYGVNEDAGAVYFASAEHSAVGMDIYRADLAGSAMTRLSRAEGWHSATFSPRFTRYVDSWSDASTPTQARLHREDGNEVRVINPNRVDALNEYRLSTPEFVKVTARDGFVMEAMLLKPPDFDPSRRYPVYQFTYAGPGTQSATNRWAGSQHMYHQLLAQRGVIVWVLDNRSASGKGAESQWPVYGRLGEQELEDLEDGIAWLKRQSFVDASRVILHGWSYGGFMTAYALTHSSSWSAGIAGAPVTDWRDYDTVYTERLMKLPQDNPEGYRRTAPRFAAANLRGRFLLIHGTMDDNVHMQNTVQLAYELQRADKPFEMMIYATQRHGVTDAALDAHLAKLMFDFVLSAAGATTPAAAGVSR